ncbi:MAG: transglutaminase family protein [Myxococcales bacterium]|nr:transglutaminase family protein [Myxococcales bacterium]
MKTSTSARDEFVEVAALRIAADAKPGLDTRSSLAELDTIGERVRQKLRGETTPIRQAEVLAEIVYGEYGYHGNGDDYYDPRNSYLDDVIRRRTGIPLTLAVVLIAVGRRAGITVEGIGFPGHFLARVGGVEGVFVDPFDQGNVLSGADLEELAKRYLGDATLLRPEHLEPATTETMSVRMLINLEHVHRRRGDFANALVVCDRLVDLTGAPEHRRDRGLLAIALGAYASAAEDLGAYIDACPKAKDVPTVRVALEQLLGQIESNLQ